MSKQDQVQELLKRVQRLEAQVAELKRQREADVADAKRRAEAERKAKSAETEQLLKAVLADMQADPKHVIETPKGATVPQIAPETTLDGQRVPKDWIPREFNGVRYYDIPINGRTPGR